MENKTMTEPFDVPQPCPAQTAERIHALETDALLMARGLIELWDDIRPQDADEWLSAAIDRARQIVRQSKAGSVK